MKWRRSRPLKMFRWRGDYVTLIAPCNRDTSVGQLAGPFECAPGQLIGYGIKPTIQCLVMDPNGFNSD